MLSETETAGKAVGAVAPIRWLKLAIVIIRGAIALECGKFAGNAAGLDGEYIGQWLVC